MGLQVIVPHLTSVLSAFQWTGATLGRQWGHKATQATPWDSILLKPQVVIRGEHGSYDSTKEGYLAHWR